MEIKQDLFHKIQNLSINEEEIDRFPPEIDELALLIATETIEKISKEFNIKLSIYEWIRFKAIIQSQLSYTIRRIKYTPPPYPGFKESFDKRKIIKMLIELFKQFEDNHTQNLASYQQLCYELSCSSGWWKDLDPKDKMVAATKLCLIHSEISEALEGMRKDKMDTHLPHRLSFEVELTDAVIRIFDLAGALGFDIQSTMIEKLEYNSQRLDHQLDNRAKDGGKKI